MYVCDACVLIGLDQVYDTVCVYVHVCAVDCVCMFVFCACLKEGDQ